MAEKVQIVVEAVDKATAPLKNVSKSMGGLNTGMVNLAAGLSVARTAMGAVNQVFQTAKKVVDETVGAYISYANAMQDGSRLTGIAVDEYSRLVQVADDVRLSQEQLKTAFTIASRQGIDVSIEGLQKLSEQYNALTDPTQKAQLLLKTFGRSGADMGRLMELGADGIREATGAVADNLIVTAESARKAEELRLQQDALNDAWQGVKNTVAQALIPTLSKLAVGMNNVLTYSSQMRGDFEETAQTLKTSNRIWEDYALELVKVGMETGQLHDMSARLAQALIDGQIPADQYDARLEQLVIELGGVNEETRKAINFTEGLNDMVNEGIPYFGALNAVLPSVTGNLDDLAAAEEEAKQKASFLRDVMGELTKELLFNKAAANLDEDAAYALAGAMGLINTETEAALLTLQQLREKYDINRDGAIDAAEAASGYTTEVLGLSNAISALQDRKITVTVDTINRYFTEDYSSGGRPNPADDEFGANTGFSKGANFVVPPGYPNDSFGPLYVESGERVVVIPKSEQVDKRTFNFNYTGNATAQNIQQAYEMARLLN